MPYLLVNHQHIPITIDPSQEIGSGGMGVVYRIGTPVSQQPLVAKIFKHPHDNKNPSLSKLQTMIERPPQHVYQVIGGVGYTQFAWVQYLIMDDRGQLIGYAMPELDFDRSISLNPFIYPREAERLTDYQKSLNYRVQLCANISALMADLHAHGHAFIDFKEQNIRLMPEPNTGRDDDYKGFIVGFIDCDSYRITRADGKVYPSPVISPEMTSPEYHLHKDIALLDEKHDRFVLAIELFKILNNGIHPFYFIPLSDRLKNLANRDTDHFIKERLYAYGLVAHGEIAPLKASIHHCFDETTRAMFDQAFLSHNPEDRPSAQAWEIHFRTLISERQFTACQNHPDDASHIHFVGKPCHRCLLAPKTATHASEAASPQNNYSSNPWLNAVPSAVTQTEANTQMSETTSAVAPNLLKQSQSEALAKNRHFEQSLNASLASRQAQTPTPKMPPPIPQSPANTTAATAPKPAKPTKKWGLVAAAAMVLAAGGYGVATLSAHQSDQPSSRASNRATATAAKNDNNDNNNFNNNEATKPIDPNSYQAVINSLPKAKSDMAVALDKYRQSANSVFGAKSAAAVLYANALNMPPAFFEEVANIASTGEPTLKSLQTVAYRQDIAATQAASIQAFRDTDMGYFAQLPVNKNLAKQFNDAAKNYFWRKKDPQGALYLQAQAVKNSPNQGEYVANLAYYLVKNDYPAAKNFVLYALQTPRNDAKYPNTYMIELAAALAIKEGDDAGAVGALLTQFYTTDEKEKRCQNMLRYPQTYPELVPVAEKVLTIIDEQHTTGINPAPEACLPPYDWVRG
ncbi:MAG: hypothetical protein ACRC7U_04795 [Moraxella sp.]|jgi:serine/threonine protein kinase